MHCLILPEILALWLENSIPILDLSTLQTLQKALPKHLYLITSFSNTMTKKSKLKVMKFKVLVEKDEDGYYVADVPELQGCHTQAKNQKELMKRVKEVIGLCHTLK